MGLIYRFAASYAGVPLQVVSWQMQRGRGVIQHRPSRGDGAQLSDRGQNPRIDQLSVTLTGSNAEISAARDTLLTLDGTGQARTFVHPMDGQWAARLEAFTEQVGAEGVTYSMTLIEDRDFPVRVAQSVQIDAATLEDVRTAASRLDAARAELEAQDPAVAAEVPSSAATMGIVEGWNPSSTPAKAIATDLEAIRAASAPTQERLDRERSRAAYNTGIALLELRGAVERYARRLQQISPRTFPLEVLADAPLIAILTRLYGAEEGARLLAEVVRVNSIIAPVRVKAGTVLRLPTRS